MHSRPRAEGRGDDGGPQSVAYFIVPVDDVPELRRALESADLARTKEDRLPARSVVEVRRSCGQDVNVVPAEILIILS